MSPTDPLSSAATLDALPCGFVQIDAQDRVVHWNQRLERWTRIPRSFATGRTLTNLFPQSSALPRVLAETRAQDRPRVLAQQFHRWLIPVPLPAGHLSGLAEMQQECHLVPLAEPAGHLAITIIDATPLLVGQQRAHNLLAERTAARDSAEASLAELAQRESELRDLFDGTSDLIQSVTLEGRILFVNAAWRRTLGYEAADLTACNLFDIIDPAEHDSCRDAFRRLLAGEELGLVETFFRTKGGLRIAVEGNVTLRRVAGQPLATRGIFRDVTSRRAAEAEVLGYKDRLDLALTAANTCTWENDVVAGVLHLDARWSVMRGGAAQPTTIRNEAALRLAHPADRVATMRHFRECFTGQTAHYRIEQRVQSLHGDWIWILSSGRVVSRDSAGRATRLIGTNTDITAQKRAEEQMADLNAQLQQMVSERTLQLSESERRYQRLVGLLPVAVYACAADGTLTYYNDEALRIWGRRPPLGDRTVRYSGACRHWRPDGSPLPHDHTTTAAAIREGRCFRNVEVIVEQPDGRRLNVVANTDPLLDDSGAIIGAINAVSDVTAHKLAETALRESEQRFRSVFDHSPVIIALLSFPEGRIVEINAAAENAFLISRNEAVGRTAVELAVWADHADRDRYLALLARDGSVRGFETRLRRRDDTFISVLFSGSVVTVGPEKFSLNLMLDISARIAADQARERSLSLLRATLESAADGILVVDGDGRIENFNGHFAELWHLAAATPGAVDDDTLLGAIAAQLPFPEQFLESIRVLHRQSTEDIFDILRTNDGRVFERYSRPQLINGAPAGRVWSFRDITARTRAESERQRLEATLRQAQKIESLGTLAGGIAHDFNNILTGFFGFVELARDALPPKHPSEEYLNLALGAAARARNLVRQILTFSRKNEGERRPLQLTSVATEALKLLRSTIPAMVELRIQFTPDCPLVMADPTQIHQILMNLCTNAWHAAPPSGGVITVSLAPATITPARAAGRSHARTGPAVLLSVEDNGAGMDTQVLSRIFEPFFTTKEAGKGTGLGLAVVHGIVESHGGVIEVRSAKGAGTTFDIFIPALATQSTTAATPGAATPVPKGHGEHILWVDDDQDSGQVIGLVLQLLNYRVTSCSDPHDALARFSAAPDSFAMAITDLAMPGMSGATLAKRLLDVRPSLPVIVISGFVDPSQHETLLASGIRAVLRKPPARHELAEAVAQHLRTPRV